jgi:hypothetical protein
VQFLCVSVTVIAAYDFVIWHLGNGSRSPCTVMRRCGQAFLLRLVALPYRSPSRPVDNCRSPVSKNFLTDLNRREVQVGCYIVGNSHVRKENGWCRTWLRDDCESPIQRAFLFKITNGLLQNFFFLTFHWAQKHVLERKGGIS